jgi:hypothetical protein
MVYKNSLWIITYPLLVIHALANFGILGEMRFGWESFYELLRGKNKFVGFLN